MARKSKQSNVVVSPPSPTRSIKSSVTEKTQKIYCNNAMVEGSNWDVRIRLGLIQSVTPELVSVEDVAHVYMSHEHAKAFADALNSTLRQLEAAKLQETSQAKVQ